jgi:hypothetical protein
MGGCFILKDQKINKYNETPHLKIPENIKIIMCPQFLSFQMVQL